ncbi:hypothetical protein MYX19_04685 [Nitrospinae bacterium AH-259-F20]|nr:hypothetical protein [Nitrospinae bacterium AH-259-F20]
MPTVRNETAAAAIDGKLYVVGGGTPGCCPAFDTLEVFDPNDGPIGSWSTLEPMPTARRAPAAAVIDGKLYVVGGFLGFPCCPAPPGAGAPLGTLEKFDPDTDSWETSEGVEATLTPMPTPRSNLAAGVINGKLYVVGGSGSILDTVEVYDPATDTWSTETSMPTPRQRLAAAVIAGKLYAVGGDDAGGTLDTLEIFTPVVTAIGLTIDEVETLVNSDLLNQGQGNALVAKLGAAIKKLDQGKDNAAINQLEAFINQVSALVKGGVLSDADGQPLINAANTIISELS